MLLRSGSNVATRRSKFKVQLRLRRGSNTASQRSMAFGRSMRLRRGLKVHMKPEPNNIRLTFHKANTDTELVHLP